MDSTWGWDEGWALAFAPFAETGLLPARVIAQHRGRWLLAGESPEGDPAEWRASLTGRLRHEAARGGHPAVGDWVGYVRSLDDGESQIDGIVPRRSTVIRRAAGSRNGAAQVLAANVDVLFIATSLNGDLNPRRLERYVAMGLESGAETVVLLTKADLVDDAAETVERLRDELHVEVIAVSARTGRDMAHVDRWFAPGRTLALVGSSGVGKSTLLNRLAGEQLMNTQEIREDDARGRHTTTHRELFRLPGGSLMLDTPGMRELGLVEADEGVAETFVDIEEMALDCRFPNCSHTREPGCAVQVAVSKGELDDRRVASFRRLAKELADQPAALRREKKKQQWLKAIHNASADSIARKTYRER
jgi:ribosome biogenesis GTPase